MNGDRGCHGPKDYFDLASKYIKDGFNYMELGKNFKQEYVEKFHLQDYYKDDKIILFYEGRELGKEVIPSTKENMKLCILEMIKRIIKRGIRIMNYYDKNGSEKFVKEAEELIKLYDEEKYNQALEIIKKSDLI